MARTGRLGATGMYVVILVPLTAGWLTDWIGVSSGLNTHLGGIAGGAILPAFGLILLAGFAGKYFRCALAMRGMGFGWRESYAVGALPLYKLALPERLETRTKVAEVSELVRTNPS
ncbi:hypothetical protein ACIHFD_36680 [Nonomuraea sp. NPDC051941]|uniref:hypothetical protein n=1 Tax=Nonomuraea sp. NPDC051941 TaxID=3364373 RepID=UPI0037C9EBC1